jgi:hypothetical protein
MHGGQTWMYSSRGIAVVLWALESTIGSVVQVSVQLRPGSLEVRIGERAPLLGPLWAEIKAEESTWYCLDGLLHLSLLKRCRRGAYGAGRTAADTFWRAVRTLQQNPTPIIHVQCCCNLFQRQHDRRYSPQSGLHLLCTPVQAL